MLTKSELIFKIKSELGDTVTKKTVENVVDAYCRVVGSALAAGEDVKITDIGVLKPVDVAERKCINPIDGKTMIVPEHKTVRFRISKYLKDKLQ